MKPLKDIAVILTYPIVLRGIVEIISWTKIFKNPEEEHLVWLLLIVTFGVIGVIILIFNFITKHIELLKGESKS